MKPIKLTGVYKVDQILKKSKARYADGIIEGDIIKFELEMINTTGASNGNYVLYADMYINDNLKCNISQNEFCKLARIMDLVPLVPA